MVVIDYFSKGTTAEAKPEAKAETAFEYFLNWVINQFGVPIQVFIDQGSVFTSRVEAMFPWPGNPWNSVERTQQMGVIRTRVTKLIKVAQTRQKKHYDRRRDPNAYGN